MVRKILCMLVLLLVVASVSAATTEVVIETYANHDITAIVMASGQEKIIETFQENSGSTGRLAFSFSGTESKVDISVTARKDGKIIIQKRLEEEPTGGQITIELIKTEPKVEKIEEVVNETEEVVNDIEDVVNETVEVQEEAVEQNDSSETINATEESDSLTGAGIFDSKVPSKVYIIVIVIFVLGVLTFFIVKVGLPKNPEKIKIRKYSEMKGEMKGVSKEDSKKIQELESRMEAIKKEIDTIKNKKSKIQEVEERLKRDMEELRILRGEEAKIEKASRAPNSQPKPQESPKKEPEKAETQTQDRGLSKNLPGLGVPKEGGNTDSSQSL